MTFLKRFWRDYHLEFIVVSISIGLTATMYALFINGTMAKEFISVASAGFLFVLAQMYGRLKDRRDIKRKRAQELFLEWHSKEIRESRIYLSRWRANIDENRLPALGVIETDAASEYKIKYKNLHKSAATKKEVHELDNPALREFHAFKLYQFFERWSLLVRNNDIDPRSANEYMHSYKDWWLDNFIVAWLDIEPDDAICQSLQEILVYLRPGRKPKSDRNALTI
jgi:hypothetical protein